MAGRDRGKLERLVSSLAAEGSTPPTVVVADVNDPASLLEMARCGVWRCGQKGLVPLGSSATRVCRSDRHPYPLCPALLCRVPLPPSCLQVGTCADQHSGAVSLLGRACCEGVCGGGHTLSGRLWGAGCELLAVGWQPAGLLHDQAARCMHAAKRHA